MIEDRKETLDFLKDFKDIFETDRLSQLLKNNYNSVVNLNTKFFDAPAGEYICKVKKIEVTKSKNTNKNMLKTTFELADSGQLMYSCIIIETPKGQLEATCFLQSFKTENKIIYGSLDIFSVVAEKTEHYCKDNLYKVLLTKTNNGFSKFRILDKEI